MKTDLKLWYGVSVNRKNREDLVEMSMTGNNTFDILDTEKSK